MWCDYLFGHTQHPFTVEFVERQVRIQIKDQIDRMKRRKVDEYEYSGSDEEYGGGSLYHPTIKKSDEGTDSIHLCKGFMTAHNTIVQLTGS